MRKLATTMLLALGVAALGACSASPDAFDDATNEAPLTPAPVFNGDPANKALFGVDISFWETPVSQAEMDCFWASGVRHVVVGTQDEAITREQLAMAISRGMTVDAYVYLYWNTDLAAQVHEAFRRVKGLPIGRMWLDIEQDPGSIGSKTILADIQQAVTTCKADGSVQCGIYTGSGFWKSYINNTTSFNDVPLWYAQYNYRTSLSDWPTEHFGGWAKPTGKQWATKPLCGIGGVDWDTIQVSATPTVNVDRTLPPDTGLVPPAPTGVYPLDGDVEHYGYVKMMSQMIPRATSYQIGLERWNGKAWATYYTWTNANAFVKNSLVDNSLYHFHVRAQNAHGWGAWSDWSSFDYGKYTGIRPSSAPPPNPPPQPPPSASVPTALAPDGNVLVTASPVTLSCSGVTSATSYEFAIESQSGNSYIPYYTYAPTAASQTFYPAIHGVGYRWRVRAKVSGVLGAWSPYATFQLK